MSKSKSTSRPRKQEKSRLKGQSPSQEEIIAAGIEKHGQFLQNIFIIFYKSINGVEGRGTEFRAEEKIGI